MDELPVRAVTRRDLAIGTTMFALTGFVVAVATTFGHGLIPTPDGSRDSLVEAFCRYDGNHYRSVCDNGYTFHPAAKTEVAFYPAYPLLGRLVRATTGWSTAWALLAVAAACNLGGFVVLHAYVRTTRPDDPLLPGYALAAFGLFPTTCFFRFAYSESLFFLLAMTALLGMARRWPAWVVALVVGAATAARPVGIALLLPFALDLWRHAPSWRQYLLRLVAYGPLACWGLIVYAAYLEWTFGEPLAFAIAQANWRMRPQIPVGAKVWKLLTLEPFVYPYTEVGRQFWAQDSAIYSLPAANPVLFGGSVLLVAWGALRRRLTAGEVLLAAGLFLLPYVGRGYDFGSLSLGRFAAVVPAIYLVIADGLRRRHPAVAAAVLALSGCYLAMYAAQFAAIHKVF